MATDLAKKAKDAFIDDHFQLAADLYTQAINIDSQNAELYADRAQANLKLENFTEAVADANKAIELDPSMAKAYLRKGTACIKLEEYETAKAALVRGASLPPEDPRFRDLIKKCEQHITEESDDLAKQTNEKTAAHIAENESSNVTPDPARDAHSDDSLSCAAAMQKPKFRHEFYQKPEEVVVTIFAKNIPAEHVTVNFGEQILDVKIDIPGEEPFQFQPRLFGKIIPGRCKYAVLSTKIEIRLAKAEKALQWTSLEFGKETTVLQRFNVSSVSSERPTYPSSKPTRVDWDKLEAQLKKEEKEEKLDGDAGLNKFFRDIYADADDDTRRAMRKSFVESNGTVLSTNWKEVGSKKVEGSPPDGMEMKKWEY